MHLCLPRPSARSVYWCETVSDYFCCDSPTSLTAAVISSDSSIAVHTDGISSCRMISVWTHLYFRLCNDAVFMIVLKQKVGIARRRVVNIYQV